MIKPYKMAILALMGAMDGLQKRVRHEPLDGIDLKAEYNLIKQKKSKLSAALRRQVIAKIEANIETKS